MKGKLFKAIISALSLTVVVIAAILVTKINFSEVKDKIVESNPNLYSVVSISDGDTIVVDMNGVNEKVRFIGIDTPEKNHPEFAVQCFALEAESHLRELVGDSKVRLEADPENSNRDIYDRLLRFVYLPDGTFLNERMISDGYAFAYTSYSNSNLENFQSLEKQASSAKLGLWSSCEVDLQNGRPLTNPVN